MKKMLCLLIGLWVLLNSNAQIQYSLQYRDSLTPAIQVRIRFPSPRQEPIRFVMPRSIPGSYSLSPYDAFLGPVYAVSTNGEKIPMDKDPNGAPAWHYKAQGAIDHIVYSVRIRQMETKLQPSDASIIRPGFIGLLNYSILGWVEGTEKEPLICKVETFTDWPIFCTLEPSTHLAKGQLQVKVKDYYTLADAQIFAGPRFQVKVYQGPVPFFVAAYADQGDEYLDDYGRQGIMSLNILQQYFGDMPFQNYSLMLRKSMTPDSASVGSFGMEHLQSATFFGDTAGFRINRMDSQTLIRTMPTFLHHIGHAFIPLRCYGDNYRPYVQEMPPLIRNIWFNEGFMWFLPYTELKSGRLMQRFIANTTHADPDIKRMNLLELSTTASFLYAQDFRLGMGVYSRGALMANDMNQYLLEKSSGQKSMKDLLRYLYNWSRINQRPFTMEEFPKLINQSTGIDLGPVYQKWQGIMQ